MLWFDFMLGLNFIFLCFKLIIIHYHTQKQREIKFKPRIKLNHNIYIHAYIAYIHEVEMRRSAILYFGYRKGKK